MRSETSFLLSSIEGVDMPLYKIEGIIKGPTAIRTVLIEADNMEDAKAAMKILKRDGDDDDDFIEEAYENSVEKITAADGTKWYRVNPCEPDPYFRGEGGEVVDFNKFKK